MNYVQVMNIFGVIDFSSFKGTKLILKIIMLGKAQVYQLF